LQGIIDFTPEIYSGRLQKNETSPPGRDLPLRPPQKAAAAFGSKLCPGIIWVLIQTERSGAVACPSAYGRQKSPGLSLQGQAAALSALKTVKPSN